MRHNKGRFTCARNHDGRGILTTERTSFVLMTILTLHVVVFGGFDLTGSLQNLRGILAALALVLLQKSSDVGHSFLDVLVDGHGVHQTHHLDNMLVRCQDNSRMHHVADFQ